jgi:hypothetical protein
LLHRNTLLAGGLGLGIYSGHTKRFSPRNSEEMEKFDITGIKPNVGDIRVVHTICGTGGVGL